MANLLSLTMRSKQLLLTFLLLITLEPSTAQTKEDLGLYLYRISANAKAPLAGDGIHAPLVELQVEQPALLVNWLANSTTTIDKVGDTTVSVYAEPTITLSGTPEPKDRAASFIVDFQDPAVENLVDSLVAQHGQQPDIQNLTQFVFDTIPKKNHSRGFDFASRVAKEGEGDCTEHAVLITALARATNRPARIVLGLLLIEVESVFSVYGHAWSEIHDGGNWHIADATLPVLALPKAIVKYIPLLSLTNEGPGYGMDILQFISVFPSKVSLIPRSSDP